MSNSTAHGQNAFLSGAQKFNFALSLTLSNFGQDPRDRSHGGMMGQHHDEFLGPRLFTLEDIQLDMRKWQKSLDDLELLEFPSLFVKPDRLALAEKLARQPQKARKILREFDDAHLNAAADNWEEYRVDPRRAFEEASEDVNTPAFKDYTNRGRAMDAMLCGMIRMQCGLMPAELTELCRWLDALDDFKSRMRNLAAMEAWHIKNAMKEAAVVAQGQNPEPISAPRRSAMRM